MVVRAAAFVVAQEEDRIQPRRAVHELAENVCDLRLSREDRLARARMLVVDSVAGFNIGEAGQRSIGHVREELAQRRDVCRVNAEWLDGSPTACFEPTVGATQAAGRVA